MSALSSGETQFHWGKSLGVNSLSGVDGIRNVIRLLGATNEKIRRLKAEDLVDDGAVRKMEKEGRL